MIEVATMTGTHQGAWAGPAPTGQLVRLAIIIHFPWQPTAEKFAGEKIYFDRAALAGKRPRCRKRRSRTLARRRFMRASSGIRGYH